MTTITAKLTRANILKDMKVKSHAEVAAIKDSAERYLAELGSEKEQEANQCINDAVIEIKSVLRQMMTGMTATATVTEAFDASSTEITFAFELTSRKSAGFAEDLGKALHPYIVDSALHKFYMSVSRPDIAERHAARLAAELAVIENIVYRKTTPTYT